MMRISEILKASLATLRMNGRRTFLTMIGIIIGIAAVITILSLGKGFEKQTLDSLAKDEKGRRSQIFYYNISDFDQDPSQLDPFSSQNVDYISSLPGVDEVSLSGEQVTEEYMGIRYRQLEEYYTVAISESTQYRLLDGRNLNLADSNAKMPYAMIDEMTAMTFFGQADQALHKVLTIDSHDYTIVGVFIPDINPDQNLDPMVDNGMMNMNQLAIPTGTYRRFSLQSSYNYSMKVFYQDAADMKGLNQEINQYLQDNGHERENGTYEYYDMTETMDEIGNQLKMITLFITAIAAISLFIAGVGVMNMMYISVAERTKEIGIRRSIGATKQSIQWQFLLEGIAITTLGGLIGYVLGFTIAKIIGNFISFQAVFDIPTALLTVVISVLIGILSSVFPARQASRKNVIEILR
ncbi:ABC transporter permease [Facklamia languida]